MGLDVSARVIVGVCANEIFYGHQRSVKSVKRFDEETGEPYARMIAEVSYRFGNKNYSGDDWEPEARKPAEVFGEVLICNYKREIKLFKVDPESGCFEAYGIEICRTKSHGSGGRHPALEIDEAAVKEAIDVMKVRLHWFGVTVMPRMFLLP